MFTGLIQDMGEVIAVERLQKEGVSLWIRPRRMEVETFARGESVAVDGCCLTALQVEGGAFEVEVSPETLAKTTLDEVKVGTWLNLERALAMGDRLGGHMVLGHVDGVGRIESREEAGDFVEVWFSVPEQIERWLVEKGSVTVDGISLTVNEVGAGRFSVMLIPETLAATGLGGKRVGARVNLEGDVIGKYVERLLGPHRKEHGLS